jgi:hypothetical protein
MTESRRSFRGQRTAKARVACALVLTAALTWGQGPRVTGLRIVTIQGEGAFNDVKRKTAMSPGVEVRDQLGRPVVGAEVLFTLPQMGPSATFTDGSSTYKTTTGSDGRAVAIDMRPNSQEGRFNIRVSATYEGVSQQAVIPQSNTTASSKGPKGGGSGKTALILALVGGGAAAGLAVALGGGGGGGGSTPTGPAPVPATTLSVGAVTIGGPR